MKRLFFILSVLGILGAGNAEAASMTISPAGFTDRGSETIACGKSNNYLRMETGTDGFCFAQANIPLPAGTVISSIEVPVRDGNSGCYVEVELKKYTPSSTSVSYTQTTISNATSSDSSRVQTLTLSGTTLSAGSGYAIEIDLQSNTTSTSGTCTLGSITINY